MDLKSLDFILTFTGGQDISSECTEFDEAHPTDYSSLWSSLCEGR